MRQEKLALLIDAENISQRYITKILKELTPIGTITYKRIYRDWTNNCASGWKEVLLNNGLFPVQQYSYTTGKNATDFAIIIDAMDILYEGNVDTFCLATSDSDFTRLAVRLREAGKKVIGLGERKTPTSFVATCDQYIYLDEEKQKITKECIKKEKVPARKPVVKKEIKIPKKSEIEAFTLEIVKQNDKKKIETNLNELSRRIHEEFPEFKPQHYKCAQLKKLMEQFHSIKLVKKNNCIYVQEKGKQKKEVSGEIETVEREIIKIIHSEQGKIYLGQLNQQLVEKNQEYSYKRFGYKKFSNFVLAFKSIQLKKTPSGREIVMMANQ